MIYGWQTGDPVELMAKYLSSSLKPDGKRKKTKTCSTSKPLRQEGFFFLFPRGTDCFKAFHRLGEMRLHQREQYALVSLPI